MDTYWLPASSTVIASESQALQNVSKPKETNVGTVAQSTMASFANIFAGASAAIASSSNVPADMLVSISTSSKFCQFNFII